MIRHILRLVWNRRTSNALVGIEIVVSFLVLFAVAAFAVFFFQNARRPLGFETDNVWYVQLRPNDLQNDSEEALAERRSVERLVARELASMDRIDEVAVVQPPPYSGWMNSTSWDLGDRRFQTEMVWASPEALEVLRLDLIAGRWFEPGDDQLAYRPVVVNRHFAQAVFGDEDALGQTIRDIDPDDPPEQQEEYRVIGIVSDYRKAGEFSSPHNVTLNYLQPGGDARRVFFLGFRVAPGTPAQLEEEIARRLQSLAPSWSFNITALEDARADYRRSRLLQLLLFATVAGFLLLMVGLGLLGVLWQTVTQRTQEIGVRRAKGAPAQKIHLQILGELLAVTALSIAVATILLLQLPLVGWFDFLSAEVTVPAFLLAVATMFALALISGLYPSWLATRVQPSEALHYE